MNTMRLIAMTVALCLATVAIAQNGAEDSGIAPQPLDSALKEFAEKSGLQVIYVAKLADGKNTSGAKANRSDTETLEQLLASTGLEYEFLNANTVTVQAVAEEEVASDPGNSRTRPILMAQNQTPAEENQTASTKSDDDEEEELELERIAVTGTNIRGIAPESSPVRVFTREDIQISGAATAQDFIQTLTANFGGGSTADSGFALPNDVNAGFNDAIDGGSNGSSVNLRGLGSGSTLVLLNGHRLAPSSGIGDFVDISMIPASAIERVEVLTDGASSIYGGDAVAGVVNFVLRDDLDGVETSLRYGTVTEGDLNEYRGSFTGGKNWGTGNALVVYEYFKQDDLSAGDRVFSQGAILPHDLLPSEERHSVLTAASQDVASNLRIHADFFYSNRDSDKDLTDSGGTFLDTNSSSDYLSAAASGLWKVSETWFIDFSGTYSYLQTNTDVFVSGNPAFVREVDSDLWTADLKASGTALQLPGGELKLALGGHYRRETFSNFRVDRDLLDRQADRDVYALYGEAMIPIIGPENTIPGAERLEVNVSGRFEDYSDFGSTANPKVGLLWSPLGGLNFRGSYSTSFNPPPLGRVGASDFVASAALQSRWNSIFGLVPGDPSIADVVVITVFGTDTNLDAETSRAFTAGFDYRLQGTNHNFAFDATYFNVIFEGRLGSTPVPGNRVLFDAPNIAFNSPDLFPAGTVIFSPSQEQIANILNDLDRPPTIVDVDPLDAEIINLVSVVRNLSRSEVSGVDFDVFYTFNAGNQELLVGLNGTFLQDFKQQAATTTPLIEQINTLYNPIDLRLRGRAGYSRDGFAGNIFVNYANKYRTDNTADAASIDSWTTFDLSISYDTQNRMKHSILNNTIFRFSVLNIFNDAPPSTISNPNFGIFGFDPANASPLGRFIAFEVTKNF